MITSRHIDEERLAELLDSDPRLVEYDANEEHDFTVADQVEPW